jgi:hypothetical protein
MALRPGVLLFPFPALDLEARTRRPFGRARGTDGGGDDAALGGDVPAGRWPGLRTRDTRRGPTRRARRN